MKFKKEIPFEIEGLGELKAVITALTFKIYQNGQRVTKKGVFKHKFLVRTNDGETAVLNVNRNMGAYCVSINGRTIQLEEKLMPTEYYIALIPFIIFVFLGGWIGAMIGTIVLWANIHLLKQYKRRPVQIAITLGLSALGFACYFLAVLVFVIIKDAVSTGWGA